MLIVSAIVAGIVAAAANAGQSVSAWISSPAGQKQIRKIAQQVGPNVFQEIEKLLNKYL